MRCTTSAANTVAICKPCPAWSSRDIRALLRAQRGRLNMQEVQGYFALFDRQVWPRGKHQMAKQFEFKL
jgi:hypothetical protein